MNGSHFGGITFYYIHQYCCCRPTYFCQILKFQLGRILVVNETSDILNFHSFWSIGTSMGPIKIYTRYRSNFKECAPILIQLIAFLLNFDKNFQSPSFGHKTKGWVIFNLLNPFKVRFFAHFLTVVFSQWKKGIFSWFSSLKFLH